MRRAKALSLLGAALMIAGPMALGAQAAASYNANGNIPQDVDWNVSWGCTNKSLNISVAGTRHVGLGRLKAHLQGSNGGVADVNFDASIDVNLNGLYASPKSPSQYGAGGNPYIWFRANGSESSILLGRCNEASSKQLLKKFTMRNIVALSSVANVGASGCNNQGGPNISMSKGDRGQTKGFVYYTNQNTADPAHQTADQATTAAFDMVADRVVSKGTKNGVPGVTGNPFVSVAFGLDINNDGELGGADVSAYGIDGEYYLADGTWTNDANVAFSTPRRCTDIGK